MSDRMLVQMTVAELESLIERVVDRVLERRLPPPAPDYLTLAEVRKKLSCSRSTVQRMVATGRLPRVQLGDTSRVLIPRSAVEALMVSTTTQRGKTT